MRRTALLLGAVTLGSLLAAPPALAAPALASPARATSALAGPGASAAVARVKASPGRQTGDCPTTVGFSAVLALKGKGTVRYRWVRSDGGKGAIRSVRVNGPRTLVVKDRQTFDRSVTGWQAVEVLGRRGLSGKARFAVSCSGPAQVWDASHPLPPGADKPLVAAADVDALPATYAGACPTTVTFRATIQVSRTPARVAYQWIDSATGEGRPEWIEFAAGGTRMKQVTLPLTVGGSTSGWKAVRLLTPGGHDSGRAAYQVTCKDTPPPSSPPPSSPPPSSPPPSEPPAQKPEARIVALTPGDYEGNCAEPVAYQATGRVTLPAGAAQRVAYWWALDGATWQPGAIDFPAATQPRSADVSAAWNLAAKDMGTHKLVLRAEGAAAEAAQSFTFRCALPDPDQPKLTIEYLLTPQYKGVCDGTSTLNTKALVTADRETEIQYRFVVDGKPLTTRSEVLKPDRVQSIDDFWYGSLKGNGTGTVRLEVLNHGKPVMEAPYAWTCEPQGSGAVRLDEITTSGYHGDCVRAPYVTAFGRFAAPKGTQITYRWVIDGEPWPARKATVEGSGVLRIQAAYWSREARTAGTVRLEVLDHDKPSASATYPVTCGKQ
uniref:hypothetical protein n=1 Tax=Nonomuraea pusilla TaxID=46177 RepID=UPI000ACCFD4C|nr:hypothetical protein [Nonomuraea pusilla]